MKSSINVNQKLVNSIKDVVKDKNESQLNSKFLKSLQLEDKSQPIKEKNRTKKKENNIQEVSKSDEAPQ